jgi:hypothetical protein
MRMAWITLPQPRRNKPWPSCPRRQVFLRLPHRQPSSGLHPRAVSARAWMDCVARALLPALAARAASPFSTTRQGSTPLNLPSSRAGKRRGQPVSCAIRLYGAFSIRSSRMDSPSRKPIVPADQRARAGDIFFDKDEPIRSRNPVYIVSRLCNTFREVARTNKYGSQ